MFADQIDMERLREHPSQQSSRASRSRRTRELAVPLQCYMTRACADVDRSTFWGTSDCNRPSSSSAYLYGQLKEDPFTYFSEFFFEGELHTSPGGAPTGIRR
jgi:hypothetical protein